MHVIFEMHMLLVLSGCVSASLVACAVWLFHGQCGVLSNSCACLLSHLLLPSGAPGVMLAYLKHMWASGERTEAFARLQVGASISV